MKLKFTLTSIIASIIVFSLLSGGCVPKNETERHFKNAVDFMELQMFSEAVIELQNGMKLAEKDETFVERPESSMLKGLILSFDNKEEEALLVLEETIKKHRNYWNAYLLLSSIYLKEKKYNKAIEILKKVPDSELNYGQLNFVQGLDYFEKKEFDKAIEQFKLAKSQFEQESLSFQEESGSLRFIRENANMMIYSLLGQSYAKIGKLRESLKNFEQAKRINPRIPNIDNDIAIIQFKIKLEKNPNDAVSLNNLGWAYLQKQQSRKALEAFKKAIKIKPDLALAYNNLGLLFYEEKQYEKAKYYFSKVLQLNNDVRAKFYAHFNLGRIYRRQGNFKKAISNLEAAARLNPSYEPVKREYKIAVSLSLIHEKQKDKSLYEELGNFYFENREFDNALKTYEKTPKGPRRYYNLGRVCFAKGDFKKAEVLCRLAIKDDPKFWRSLYVLGSSSKAQGKLDEAIDAFEQAVQYADPNSVSEIKNDLAYVYFESGDLKKATGKWREIKDDKNLKDDQRSLIRKIINVIS